MYNYNETEQKIAGKLIELGLPIANKGFNYILSGAILISKNDNIGIYKVYDLVAKKYNTTRSRVERAIRQEITTYYNDNTNIPRLLTPNVHTGALANGEFLCRMAFICLDILKGNGNKY